MFKKGSFEIGCTVYPVAIKVGNFSLSFFFASMLLPTPDKSVLLSCSMILCLAMLSGTAVSSAWWIICWGWWAAGPSSAVFGTCRQWTERWNSNPDKEMLSVLSKQSHSQVVYYIHWSNFSAFSQPVLFHCLCVGRGGCSAVCQQSKSSHSCTRRISGSHLVSQ